MTLDELSKAVGVELKQRDTLQLIIDTEEHLKRQEERKLSFRTNSEKQPSMEDAEAVRKFYERGNHVD